MPTRSSSQRWRWRAPGSPERTLIKYVALGDSVSISLYPDLDASRKLNRPVTGLGAPELLVRNDDDVWPEFEGRDLEHRFRQVHFQNAAVDGGTLDDVNKTQLRLMASLQPDIVTLTVGGNDILQILAGESSREEIVRHVSQLQRKYVDTIEGLHEAAPDALMIIATVYDPSDGTGRIPGWPPLPVELLNPVNDTIREVAAAREWIVLSDIHELFMGHGVNAPVEERYYWSESIIEPSMIGASEIRREWLAAVERGFRGCGGLSALGTEG